MNRKISNVFYAGQRFKKELKRELRMLVVVTLSFTIAFTWRQTVFDISQNFVSLLIHVQNSAVSSILTSTFITLVSIVLIYITSYYLKDNYENY